MDARYWYYSKGCIQTNVDPVKATLSTSGWPASMLPKAPLPVTTLNTPGGRPASAHISASSRALSDVNEAGFSTTVLPIARAGATFHVNNISGKFQGTIAPTTPVTYRGKWYFVLGIKLVSSCSILIWVLNLFLFVFGLLGWILGICAYCLGVWVLVWNKTRNETNRILSPSAEIMVMVMNDQHS